AALPARTERRGNRGRPRHLSRLGQDPRPPRHRQPRPPEGGGRMTIEDQLHDTFSTAVAGLDCPDRWEEVVSTGRRRRRNRRIGVAASAAFAVAAVVGVVVSVTGGPATRQVKIAPAHGSPTTPITAAPSTAAPAPTHP